MSATSEKPQRRAQPHSHSLPEPLSMDVAGKCAIKYVDMKPVGHKPQQPTIVLIHGSPGTYKDFRYLMPLFTQDDVRVIGINLPGFGGSEVVDTKNHYEHISALGEAAIAYEALVQICKGEESIFLVGHSFGGLTTLHLVAMNAEKAQLKLRGIGLLASAGCRLHRAMWPKATAVLFNIIRYEIPVMSSLAESFVRFMYTNMFGFPSNEPTSHYVTGLIRCHTTSFDLVNEHINQAAQLPSFLAWAKDDPLIEEDIFVRMSEQLCPGPCFAFDEPGHNLQKSKADVLAVELTRWMDDVISRAE